MPTSDNSSHSQTRPDKSYPLPYMRTHLCNMLNLHNCLFLMLFYPKQTTCWNSLFPFTRILQQWIRSNRPILRLDKMLLMHQLRNSMHSLCIWKVPVRNLM